MRVAIQLQHDLGVAPGGIVLQPVIGPENPFPLPAGNGIPMPIDVRSEFNRIKIEELHPAPAKALRVVHGAVNPRWRMPLYEFPKGFFGPAIEPACRCAGQVTFEAGSPGRGEVARFGIAGLDAEPEAPALE